jgi:signal peptide peptidase SppA
MNPADPFPAHWAITPEQLPDLYAARGAPCAFSLQEREAAVAALLAPVLVAGPGLGADAGPGAIAVIPIRGALTKRARYYALGMDDYERALRAAAERPDIAAIVLAIDSPGGTVDGTPRLAAVVREIAAQKPVVAFADGLMASAAYWIGSQAHAIVASPAAFIGSIGTMLIHADLSVMLQQSGIKITLLTAPASTEKGEGNPFEPLGKEVKSKLTAELGSINDTFIAAVRAARPAIADGGFTGAAWVVENAPAGFVDEVGQLEAAVARAAGMVAARRKNAAGFGRASAAGFVRAGNSITTAPSATSPSSDDPHMSKLSDLKARFGADAKRFARALGFFAADPEQSVEKIEANLTAEDTAAAAASPDAEEATFGALTKAFSADKPRLSRALAHFAADSKLTVEAIAAKLQAEDAAALTTAQTDLAAEKTARVAAEKKLAAFQASGRAAPLDLGAAGGAGGATQTAAATTAPYGLNRVIAAFRADPKNPANFANN